jgi:adenosylmethionine-8-amino-7-oxononanoate aminotransferase
MGNPLACAVALASLDILAEGAWRTQVARIERELAEGLAPAAELPGVQDVRVLGGIGVLETAGPVDVNAATQAAVSHGVWLRPFRDLIYTMPPYVCTSEEIASITRAMVAAAAAGAGATRAVGATGGGA